MFINLLVTCRTIPGECKRILAVLHSEPVRVIVDISSVHFLSNTGDIADLIEQNVYNMQFHGAGAQFTADNEWIVQHQAVFFLLNGTTDSAYRVYPTSESKLTATKDFVVNCARYIHVRKPKRVIVALHRHGHLNPWQMQEMIFDTLRDKPFGNCPSQTHGLEIMLCGAYSPEESRMVGYDLQARTERVAQEWDIRYYALDVDAWNADWEDDDVKDQPAEPDMEVRRKTRFDFYETSSWV